MSKNSVAIIGGGNMGYALACSYVNQNPAANVIVSDPDQHQLDRYRESTVTTTMDNQAAAQSAKIVVLAIKPQVMQKVAEGLQNCLSNQLVISIAAGITLPSLERWLGSTLAIIRCMPNTPVLVGEGMFGLLANGYVTREQRKQVEGIIGSAGKLRWFSSDRELDAVTALSGSGPAYYFRFTEALIAAGEQIGLSNEAATELAIQTCVGAAQMLKQRTQTPNQLRKNVTSKGGTTEAALNTMNDLKVPENITRAVHAAFERSIALGNKT